MPLVASTRPPSFPIVAADASAPGGQRAGGRRGPGGRSGWRRALSSGLLALALSGGWLLAPPAVRAAQRVAKGDAVEVQQKGTWRRATVVKVAGGRPLVHYEDGAGPDEWVSPMQLRAAGSAGPAAAPPPSAPPPTAAPPAAAAGPSAAAGPTAAATPAPAAPAPAAEGAAAAPAGPLVAEATPATAASEGSAAAASPSPPAPVDPSLTETALSLGAAGKALTTARFESAEFNAVTFEGVSMTGNFDFENPTGSPLSFERLDWAFRVGPNKLVGGSSSKQSIGGGARQRLAVPVTLQFNALPGLVASLVRGKVKYAVEAAATMKGSDGAAFVVPMRWDGDLALPKLPSVSVSKLELTELGLSEIVVTLVLAINNPNPFPIPLDGARGTVSISRIQVAQLALAEPKLIAASGTTPVELPITISVADVAGDVIQQVRSGKATFELSSELKVAGKSIPLSYRSAARRR
jgi:LEA14-like dessication related protein